MSSTLTPSAAERPELGAIREHMLIDGQPVRSGQGEPIAVHDPATGQVIARVPDAGAAEIDQAVRSARRAFESGPWRDMLPAGRERLLLALADLVERHGAELARLETLNNGKLLGVAQGWRSARRAMAALHGRLGHQDHGRDAVAVDPLPPGTQYSAYTLPQAVGVVGAIIPWNFPLLMAIWKIAPARRLHRGAQARRGNAADRVATG